MSEKIHVLMEDGSTGWIYCERERADALMDRAVLTDHFGQDENGKITVGWGIITEILD